MEANSLKVNGSGTYGGGVYQDVKMNGAGKVTGNLQCKLFKVNGSGEVTGHAQIEEVKVNGSAIFKESALIGKAKINGSAIIEGEAVIDELRVAGAVVASRRLKGKTVHVMGHLKVLENVETEHFISNGRFQIDGLLAGDVIEINPRASRSRAKEIGGGQITISKKKELFMMPGFSKRGRVEADVIEGDTLYLEYTTAKVVRGQNVELGPGCDILLVECPGVYKAHPDSRVKDVHKK